MDELGYDKIRRSYVYDPAGNRTMVLATKGSEQQQTKYEYNEQNRLMRTEVLGGIGNGKSLSNVESTYFSYDANGNLLYMNKEALTPITSKPDTVDLPTFSMFVVGETKPSENPMVSWSQSYSYNAWNQMVASKANGATSLYDYNAEGLRSSVVENGVTRNMLYVYDDVVLEYDEKGNTLAVNTYGHNLISRTVGGKSLSYLYNANGDVTGLVGSAAGYDYDAFGRGISAGPAEDNPYRYGGYRFDAGSGLYYLGSRMYNPDLGRFMQEDSYRGDMKDPLSLNLYTYCSNNPLIYVDPDGYAGRPGQVTYSDDGGSSKALKKAFVAPTPATQNPHKKSDVSQVVKKIVKAVAPVVNAIINTIAPTQQPKPVTPVTPVPPRVVTPIPPKADTPVSMNYFVRSDLASSVSSTNILKGVAKLYDAFVNGVNRSVDSTISLVNELDSRPIETTGKIGLGVANTLVTGTRDGLALVNPVYNLIFPKEKERVFSKVPEAVSKIGSASWDRNLEDGIAFVTPFIVGGSISPAFGVPAKTATTAAAEAVAAKEVTRFIGNRMKLNLQFFAAVDDAIKGGSKRLLPTEGNIGTYDDLVKSGSRGDNITPHHAPSAKYMEQYNVSKGEGLSINMEQPATAGRHRLTGTYGRNMTDAEKAAYYASAPRDALTNDIKNLRDIYKQQGLYNEMRPNLQEYIKTYQEYMPELFKK